MDTVENIFEINVLKVFMCLVASEVRDIEDYNALRQYLFCPLAVHGEFNSNSQVVDWKSTLRNSLS